MPSVPLTALVSKEGGAGGGICATRQQQASVGGCQAWVCEAQQEAILRRTSGVLRAFVPPIIGPTCGAPNLWTHALLQQTPKILTHT